MTQEAFICDAVRTPIGRYAGALATVRTDDLAAAPISALMAKHPRLDWERLDDVILARMAALLAGLPVEVGGATVNRLCGSGLEAIAAAIRAIRAGDGEFYIAGGVESMSRSPFVLPKAEEGFSRQAEIADTTTIVHHRIRIPERDTPDALSPVVDPRLSGKFDTHTATSRAMLTDPPVASDMPRTDRAPSAGRIHPQSEERSTATITRPIAAAHSREPTQSRRGRTSTGASAIFRASRSMTAPTRTSPANTNRHDA